MRLFWGQARVFTRSAFALPWALVLAPCITAAFSLQARAEDTATSPQYSWREMWGGADATKDVWLLYTGVTLAPLSKDIYSDRLRLRLTSGYGQYSAIGNATTCVVKHGEINSCSNATASKAKREKVSVTYTDVLVGYHKQMGTLTAKAFIGASMISHDAPPNGFNNKLLGRDFGATGGLEFWWNINEQSWTSLDLSYTMAHDTGAARWRLGWRALPTLSVGPEVRFDRNALAGSARLGAFARYEWFGGEISAAAGISKSLCDSWNNDTCISANDDLAPYANINYLTQF